MLLFTGMAILGLDWPEGGKQEMDGEKRILVFTGDGKGKTTAALGMALRAIGHGHSVLVIQFMKNDNGTGEIAAVADLPNFAIRQTGLGFVPPHANPRFADHCRAAEKGLEMAAEAMASGQYDLVILDEVCGAISLGLIQESLVVDAVHAASAKTSIVLTGRNATPRIIEVADTVTEMHCIKHGMNLGHKAAKGIEY